MNGYWRWRHLIEAVGLKVSMRIVPCSCRCGGRWAWTVRMGKVGPDIMVGCVCHHPWTQVVRGVA